jgi:formamidopyrimidine-DNA glycosylase
LPELPEVETVMRAMAHRLIGRRFVAVEQRRPDLRFPLPADLPRRLGGRSLRALRRRAKFILGELDDGTTLLLHLGMSGRLLFDGAPRGVHEHLTFTFDDGSVLRFVDPRRFGMLDLWPTAQLTTHRLLTRLGLEPLEPGFDGRALLALLAGRQVAVKIALMDQTRLVGVGNIYASEALWRARVAPQRRAGTVGPRHAARLAQGIRTVLADAISAGGSSLRDYVQADGELGSFQRNFAVYERAGQPCPRCGALIERIVQAQRATYLCRACQR